MKTQNTRDCRLPASVFWLRASHVLIFFTLSFFLYPFSFISAQHMALDWQQCYGGISWEYCSDIIILEDGYFIYLGEPNTNGTWRIGLVSGELRVEVRVDDAYSYRGEWIT